MFSLASGEDMEKDNSIQKCCGGFCQHNTQDAYINEILRSLKPIRHDLFLKSSDKHDLALTKRFFTELNAGIQTRVISSNNKATNNNKKTNQEVNQKQKGFQFKFSLSIASIATDRSFSYWLNNEKTQGEILC